MFEFANVPVSDYTDPVSGEKVSLRLLHRTSHGTPLRTVQINGRDIDQIAIEEKGTYEEMLKIVEANTRVLSENDFDLTKIKPAEIIIPQ